MALLVGSIREGGVYRDYLRLHWDDLAGSLWIAAMTGAIALAIGIGAARMKERPRFRWAAAVMETAIYLAMLLPGALIASGLLSLVSMGGWGDGLQQSELIVSLGQAGRFAGVALILLGLLRSTRLGDLLEMAAVDGAGVFQRWRRVSWPHTGPVVAGTVLVIMMLSMTELAATMILLPAGVPNFAAATAQPDALRTGAAGNRIVRDPRGDLRDPGSGGQPMVPEGGRSPGWDSGGLFDDPDGGGLLG